MLNGEYDIVFPLETSQRPMFQLLGTDPEHKRHYVAPAGHSVARDELIRETLDSFDRYLDGNGSRVRANRPAPRRPPRSGAVQGPTCFRGEAPYPLG